MTAMPAMMNTIFPALGLGILKGILIRSSNNGQDNIMLQCSIACLHTCQLPKCHKCRQQKHWYFSSVNCWSRQRRRRRNIMLTLLLPLMVTRWVDCHLISQFLEQCFYKILISNSGQLLCWPLWWIWPSCQASYPCSIFHIQNKSSHGHVFFLHFLWGQQLKNKSLPKSIEKKQMLRLNFNFPEN